MTQIYVDSFSLSNVNSSIHILTHAHSDHQSIPKKFDMPIYCSPVTYELLEEDKRLKPLLIPNAWVTIYTSSHSGNHALSFYIFPSFHCIGSIGFYCNGHLYWGDGRPPNPLFYLPKPIHTIYVDHAYSHISHLPSVTQSTEWIRNVIRENKKNFAKITLCIPHFGVVEHLPKEWSYHLLLHSQTNSKTTYSKTLPNKLCEIACRILSIRLSKDSPILVSRKICPVANDDELVVVISSRWWTLDRNRTSFEPIWISDNVVRLFLSCHASQNENEYLMQSILHT